MSPCIGVSIGVSGTASPDPPQDSIPKRADIPDFNELSTQLKKEAMGFRRKYPPKIRTEMPKTKEKLYQRILRGRMLWLWLRFCIR